MLSSPDGIRAAPHFYGDTMEDEEVIDIWRAILMAYLVDGKEDPVDGMFMDDWEDWPIYII